MLEGSSKSTWRHGRPTDESPRGSRARSQAVAQTPGDDCGSGRDGSRREAAEVRDPGHRAPWGPGPAQGAHEGAASGHRSGGCSGQVGTTQGGHVMICARYARLSKKGRRLDDKAASIERQLQDAERFTVEHDLGAVTDTTVYAEPEGTSGAAYGKRKDGVSRRPAWDAMMADAAAKKFGAVVMMTPDRGSREMFKGGAAFFELYETGCAIGLGAVGPHGELKPLQQPIIPPAAEDRAQVPLERPGLDAPEHREARGPNVQGATPDPVVRVPARAVPGFAVEGPIIFMPRPVHRVEPAAQLVPKQEQPVGMVIEQFAELLHGRVVDEVALRHWRRVPWTHQDGRDEF